MQLEHRSSSGEVQPAKVNNKPNERVNTYRYLGIESDDQLMDNGCATAMVKKVQQ